MMVTCKPMDEVEPLIDEVSATTNATMDCVGADWMMWKKMMEGSELMEGRGKRVFSRGSLSFFSLTISHWIWSNQFNLFSFPFYICTLARIIGSESKSFERDFSNGVGDILTNW